MHNRMDLCQGTKLKPKGSGVWCWLGLKQLNKKTRKQSMCSYHLKGSLSRPVFNIVAPQQDVPASWFEGFLCRVCMC